MSSRTKTRIVGGVIAVLTGIGLGISSGQTQAAPLSFEIAGAPLSSASATLGPSFCFGCSINTALNPGLDAIAFTLNPGQSTTFDFFRISVGGFGGAYADVSATLAFDLPSGVTVVGEGDGAFLTLRGIVSAGHIILERPAVAHDGFRRFAVQRGFFRHRRLYIGELCSGDRNRYGT